MTRYAPITTGAPTASAIACFVLSTPSRYNTEAVVSASAVAPVVCPLG